MSESELIGITGHATVKMVRHNNGTANGAAILANAIQAVLAAHALTPEAKNAAIAAITAANATNCGSLSQQNTPDFSGDKLPLVAS